MRTGLVVDADIAGEDRPQECFALGQVRCGLPALSRPPASVGRDLIRSGRPLLLRDVGQRAGAARWSSIASCTASMLGFARATAASSCRISPATSSNGPHRLGLDLGDADDDRAEAARRSGALTASFCEREGGVCDRLDRASRPW